MKIFGYLSVEYLLEGHDGILDDVQTLHDLFLSNDKRRSKTDDIAMSWLGKQTIITQPQTNLPRIKIWRGKRKGNFN